MTINIFVDTAAGGLLNFNASLSLLLLNIIIITVLLTPFIVVSGIFKITEDESLDYISGRLNFAVTLLNACSKNKQLRLETTLGLYKASRTASLLQDQTTLPASYFFNVDVDILESRPYKLTLALGRNVLARKLYTYSFTYTTDEITARARDLLLSKIKDLSSAKYSINENNIDNFVPRLTTLIALDLQLNSSEHCLMFNEAWYLVFGPGYALFKDAKKYYTHTKQLIIIVYLNLNGPIFLYQRKIKLIVASHLIVLFVAATKTKIKPLAQIRILVASYQTKIQEYPAHYAWANKNSKNYPNQRNIREPLWTNPRTVEPERFINSSGAKTISNWLLRIIIRKISQRKLSVKSKDYKVISKRLIKPAMAERFIIQALIKNLIWRQSLLNSFILPGLEYSIGEDLQKFSTNIIINRRAWYLNIPSSNFSNLQTSRKVAAKFSSF